MNYAEVNSHLLSQSDMSAVEQMMTWDDETWSHYDEEKGSGTLNDIALAIKRQGGV